MAACCSAGRLTVLSLNELFLGLLDLNVHFLCRRGELLQRGFAENLRPIRQGHGSKVRDGLFYFFNGCGIHRRMARDKWPGRRIRLDGWFVGWLVIRLALLPVHLGA